MNPPGFPPEALKVGVYVAFTEKSSAVRFSKLTTCQPSAPVLKLLTMSPPQAGVTLGVRTQIPRNNAATARRLMRPPLSAVREGDEVVGVLRPSPPDRLQGK